MLGELRCEVSDILVTNPRILAGQVDAVTPLTPLSVRLEQDDRTKTVFYLRNVTDSEEPQSADADADADDR
jgi:hypothetical protein